MTATLSIHGAANSCRQAIHAVAPQFMKKGRQETAFLNILIFISIYFTLHVSTSDHCPKYVMPSNTWYERSRT